ncbi:phage head closure protein [Schauerella aestuarii]|uniref:phage head closure protein n=1 Tax=Schauerella aestuarii TaxID=2511204 RepID=UPI0019265137|nr:phage head closure protein [Achromobacter aestuarii]
MPLSSGKLRHRVVIQRQQNTQDPDTGDLTTTWVDLASVWASIEPLSAREFVQSSATQSNITARVTIRYRKGIDATMRILHREKIYGIEGVLADKDSGLEYLTLPCSEGVGQGL